MERKVNDEKSSIRRSVFIPDIQTPCSEHEIIFPTISVNEHNKK
jgi:hypothetical protein